ncbi:MAG: ADP-ribosylation factor-like protein [Promethearchaeota archaeon]
MSKEDNLERIKDFFKTNVIINELEDILNFKPDTLIGIDKISADNLRNAAINSIQDLANLNPESPPQIKNILPQMMIKWIKIAQVLEKAVKEQLKEQKKILMIGLDNGGKSSILAVVQDRFSIIKDLLPTRGVQREKLDFFGFPIISWDLGGQVQYREKLYFNKPELFFSEVDLVLYVIDSQDPDRFTESAQYFREVLKALRDLNEKPPILVILNKSDQDIRKTLQWQKNISAIKNKFNLIINEFENIDADYCDTTIFQKETIMKMFSIALTKISETSEIIENILEDFAKQIKGKALSLISMDGLIFGSYKRSEIDEINLNNTALLLQTLFNFHNSIGLIREKYIKIDFKQNNFTIRGEKLFEYSDLQIPVYLWLLSEKPDLLDEKLNFFKEQLLPLINLFI